ncbi:2-oxoglutaramate amidase [Thalassocella blandensis]|nr:2-oxoglutaramate amidase [Thalassocella blandensis]
MGELKEGNRVSTSAFHPSRITVCAIQMVSTLDWQQNHTTAVALLEQAAAAQCQLAVLPENFITYGDKNTPDEQQQFQFIQDYAALAKKLNLWIVAGTFPLHSHVLAKTFKQYQRISSDRRPYAACLVFDPQGTAVAAYTKLHLFDVDVKDLDGSNGVQRYCESDVFRPGESPAVFQAFNQTSGLAVCYDLRFPELFRVLIDKGCRFICFPSAFTAKTGQAHWRTLVCARAIETQCYIIAANQGGLHPNGRETWGETIIVDPWGSVLASIDKGEGIAVAEMDFDFVAQCRDAMPVSQHRRLDRC